MSRSIRLNFDNANDWAFDSSKIEFTGSLAKMILQDNAGQTFNQPFTSDSGFTYDSAKAEFSGGRVQQKNQRPTDAIFAANYNIDQSGNWGDDVLTGALNGAANVSGGELIIPFAADYCRYTGGSNLPVNAGAIKVLYTPDTPSPTGYLYASSGAAQFYLAHAGSNLHLIVKNDAGSSAINVTSSAVTWVNGQQYEIEVNFDVSGNVGNIYVDGTRIANETTFSGVRTTTGPYFDLGSYTSGAVGTTGSFDDLIFFDAVQHTGVSYTPGYTVEDYEYAASKVELPQFSYSDIGSIQAFTSFATTDTNSPKYVLNDLYYNSGWVSSDGSYAQANSEAEVLANIASLPASNSLNVDAIFDSGNSQMSVDDLTTTYTGQIYPTADQAIESVDYILSDDFILASESISEPANTSAKWVLKFSDNNYYYHNGAAWVSSNKTAAQSNTLAELNVGVSSIITGNYEQIKPVAILSSDGSDTATVTYFQMVYSFYALEPATDIPTTTLYFYIKDLLNIDFSEATFYVSSKKSFFHTERLVLPIEQSSEANSDGYVELDVIETATVNKKLNFKLEYTDPNDSTTKTVNFKSAIVPNQLTTKGDEILTPK